MNTTMTVEKAKKIQQIYDWVRFVLLIAFFGGMFVALNNC